VKFTKRFTTDAGHPASLLRASRGHRDFDRIDRIDRINRKRTVLLESRAARARISLPDRPFDRLRRGSESSKWTEMARFGTVFGFFDAPQRT